MALWGLVTIYREGGGETTKWQGGGASEVLPLQKEEGGAEKSFSRAEGGVGGTTSFEVVLTWELDVIPIVMGGGAQTSFHPLRLDYRG